MFFLLILFFDLSYKKKTSLNTKLIKAYNRNALSLNSLTENKDYYLNWLNSWVCLQWCHVNLRSDRIKEMPYVPYSVCITACVRETVDIYTWTKRAAMQYGWDTFDIEVENEKCYKTSKLNIPYRFTFLYLDTLPCNK